MNELAQSARLVAVVRTIAIEQRAELEELFYFSAALATVRSKCYSRLCETEIVFSRW